MPSPPSNFTRSDFSYDDTTGRYRSKNGRFVSRQAVRVQLDDSLDGIADEMADLSKQLQNEEITRSQWQSEMMNRIKSTHLIAAASFKGGWDNLTQSDYGRVGGLIAREYKFLRNAVQEIESGKQPINGTLVRRSRLYGQQGRPTHYRFAQADYIRRGFDEERSILNVADHCEICVSEAAKGWQPMGQMIPIGSRLCLSNDRCSVEYRNSATGETVRV